MFRLSLPAVALPGLLFFSSLTLGAPDPVSPRNANGSIWKAIPQPDGKVIVVGNFSYIGQVERAGIARLKADGTLDPTFDPGTGPNGPIFLVALQSDGKVVISGFFTTVAGIARPEIARLHSDGQLDPSFDPGTGLGPSGADVWDLRLDGDNKAVLAGSFQSVNGVTRHMLARLNQNGTVDPTFDAGRNFAVFDSGIGFVKRIALYPDGRLIAIGAFQAGPNRYDLVRVAVDGTVDENFQASGLSNSDIAAQPDGKIVLGGGWVNGSSNSLNRLNADGQTDMTFHGTARDLRVVRLQPDGRILFVDYNNGYTLRRANDDGSDDATFAPPQPTSGNSNPPSFYGMEVQNDGRILVTGTFNKINDVPRLGVARLLPDGTVDPTFVPDPSVIATGLVLNLSTRVKVGTDDHVLIGGFIIDGPSPKKLMVRAVGPSLSANGVPTPLPDPRISLRDSTGAVIASNDNWRMTQIGGLITSDQATEIQASGLAPQNDAESAMIVTPLPPGAYTAIVEGAGGGTAVVEMYDLDGPSPAARVANISTRGDVATGDDVLICGAILGGTHPTEVLVRALGPSLEAFDVRGALQDPTLTLHDSNGSLVGSNENWKDSQESDIRSTEAAPTDDREAAILRVLQPGNYTAIVRGKNNSTGIGVVEFYSL